MRGQVWTAVHALAENEGITFNDCLSIVLHLLPQIPMDISFQIQIPLIIAYCPESSIYRRWHSKQGGVSPLCKEVRASQTETLTKVSPIKEAREWTVHHLLLSLRTLWGRSGCKTPELDHAAVPEVSPHTAAGDQALPSPRSLTMARKPAVNPNPPTRRRMSPAKRRMWRPARAMLRF